MAEHLGQLHRVHPFPQRLGRERVPEQMGMHPQAMQKPDTGMKGLLAKVGSGALIVVGVVVYAITHWDEVVAQISKVIPGFGGKE